MNTIIFKPALADFYNISPYDVRIVVWILIIPLCILPIMQPTNAQGKSKVYKVWIDQFDNGNKIN